MCLLLMMFTISQKLFVLKGILERETDATHGITMARILELLSMRGIKAERKSIYFHSQFG